MSELLSTSSMVESLWWVIPERLAGVRKPTAQTFPILKQLGIDAIVSVLSDDSNLDLYEQHQIPYLWLPVQGGTAPNQEQFKQLYEFVSIQNDSSRAVAVHCSSGRRRTGTMLAALLIQQGIGYERTMQIIAEANPAVELRQAQTRFLQALARPQGLNQASIRISQE